MVNDDLHDACAAVSITQIRPTRKKLERGARESRIDGNGFVTTRVRPTNPCVA